MRWWSVDLSHTHSPPFLPRFHYFWHQIITSSLITTPLVMALITGWIGWWSGGQKLRAVQSTLQFIAEFPPNFPIARLSRQYHPTYFRRQRLWSNIPAKFSRGNTLLLRVYDSYFRTGELLIPSHCTMKQTLYSQHRGGGLLYPGSVSLEESSSLAACASVLPPTWW